MLSVCNGVVTKYGSGLEESEMWSSNGQGQADAHLKGALASLILDGYMAIRSTPGVRPIEKAIPSELKSPLISNSRRET